MSTPYHSNVAFTYLRLTFIADAFANTMLKRIFQNYKGPFNNWGRIKNKKPEPEPERTRMDSKVDVLCSLRISNIEQRRLDMLGYVFRQIFHNSNQSEKPTKLTCSSDRPLEIAHVVVDSRNDHQTTFDLPMEWLTRTSQYFARLFYNASKQPNADDLTNVYLPAIYTSHFFDFVRWLRENKIVPTLHMYATYALEHNARRTIDALALGVYIESEEYQIAAMREFLTLSKHLEWPEDFVNLIFTGTAMFGDAHGFKHTSVADKAKIVHPARRMIVAILAAKTVGRGKRKVRVGPRDKGIERGDRIASTTFWEMYDELVRTRIQGGECRWPERVEEFWAM